MLAFARPHFPLLLHVFGAMVLVGAVAAGAVVELAANRSDEPAYLRRVAFRIFLLGALPAYLVMRVGAEWMYEKEIKGLPKDPNWVGIGYGIADVGGLVFLISLILAGFASRRSSGGLSKAAGILAAITLAGWLVAIWAMGAKPS